MSPECNDSCDLIVWTKDSANTKHGFESDVSAVDPHVQIITYTRCRYNTGESSFELFNSLINKR